MLRLWQITIKTIRKMFKMKMKKMKLQLYQAFKQRKNITKILTPAIIKNKQYF